jgi:outer membrane protein TolC
MIIPLEVNSATAWFEQIGFQLDSIKQDLFMAELTFKQVLNTKEVPEIEAQFLEAKKLNLDLDTCVETAFQKRPEIYLSKLLVKFNEYGRKIEANKNKAFTVDLTGSYGQYEGHHKTEPWRSSENSYVGIKVTKPWGPSTFNTSYATEKAQPRFGQTSPTASSTISTEFNLLDNMKRLSDKKKSDVDLLRSVSDSNETSKTITFEVQDAFLKYQKAVLQLNIAEVEMKFRRNEVEVTKIRALVGETSLSNAMESLYNLSETQTRYVQAVANYQLSLVNLKKATGYGLKI